jgi:hypothetical protein
MLLDPHQFKPKAIGINAFLCGICDLGPKTKCQMRNHYYRDHLKAPCFFKDRAKPEEQLNRENYQRRKEKNLPRLRPRRGVCYLEVADDDMLESYGSFGNKISILEIKPSKQPGGGNGVFSKSTIQVGDFVTWYQGEWMEVAPDSEYTIKLIDSGGYLEGIHEAHIGSGLGSLINRPNPNQKANVRFYEIKGTVPPQVGAKAPRVLIIALKLIKPGEELLVHYGNGFQIPKWT